MSRINSNIPSMIARSNLRKANDDLQVRLQRLSTGLRINRGVDDPAGLIISNRLGSEISGLQQAVKNSDRASAVISTAEGALGEAADLLNSIKGLIVEAANTGAISNEERTANQLQIDSAIDSITRISDSASFGGLKLLNGSLDYNLSGLKASAISKAQIFNANMTNRTSLQVNVETVASAQTGRLYVNGTYAVASAAWNGRIKSAIRLEIAGSRGVKVLEFLQSATMDSIVAAVNNVSEATGVSASVINTVGATALAMKSGITFSTTDFGSDEFVSVKRVSGGTAATAWQTYKIDDTQIVPAALNFGTMLTSERDAGRDVYALINGALGTGRGLKVALPDSSVLGLELVLNSQFATIPTSKTTFHITGGGALYQLGGDINSTQQINIGLQSINAARLGGTLIKNPTTGAVLLQFLESVRSGGTNDLNSGHFQNASDIVSSAIDEISVMRGRLGALEKNTLDTNVRSIQTAIENLTSSQSTIRDADFAAETSQLTRAQILSQASTSVVQLANSQAQNVLALLQR